jgi:hypothetical protein
MKRPNVGNLQVGKGGLPPLKVADTQFRRGIQRYVHCVFGGSEQPQLERG